MIRVYIAGPYTQGDVAQNVRNALRVADYITNRAEIVPFVPHLTHFWHMAFPRAYGFWIQQDSEWLKVCHALIRIEGPSKGADLEVAQAIKQGIPVFVFKGFEIQDLNRLDVWLTELIEEKPLYETGL